LAVVRGADDALAELEEFLKHASANLEEDSVEQLVHNDEAFHDRIVALAGNAEMMRTLQNINARIHYVRVDLRAPLREAKYAEHRAIVEALKARDAEKSVQLLTAHIEPRRDRLRLMACSRPPCRLTPP
jgi:DNA-binding GntR family transcriptional regulator